MNEDLEALEQTYGPAAPYSEHRRGDRITYRTAEGLRASGRILWVQAAFNNIAMKYVIAPDEETSFIDFCLPSDVLSSDLGL